MTSVANMILI